MSRSHALRGQPTPIGTGVAVADLVATAVEQRTVDDGKIGREVGDTRSYEVNDVVLALDTAANRHHAGRQDGRGGWPRAPLPSCYGDRSGRNSLFISG